MGGAVLMNALVDPTAQLGTGVMEPIAEGPRDRAAKIQLLQRATKQEQEVDVVVLGSSRVKKLDPAWIGARHGFNAAVVGGDIFEARVMAAWLREHSSVKKLPRVVVGVDIEQFRDSSLRGSGFLDVPALASVARREAADADGSFASELDRLERLLVTWQITKASLISVRTRLGASSSAKGGEKKDVMDADEFTAAGVPREDLRWGRASYVRAREKDTKKAVEQSVAETRDRYERRGALLDKDAVKDLRELFALIQRAEGPPPLLYITPAHPAMDQLNHLGRSERHAAVLALLRELSDGGRRATIVDCSRCIDGTPESWIDATHASPLGMRQLASRLAGYTPSATPTERSGASR